ncbi:hypothetical protein TVAG_363620 [Trichomonas vaginalis G3]|uniref:Uncharacterized protein n=1 Tax=Trichomonas vaginalis (strain ATCC PRA-98 / G3) TaxID=412133 RepID=A2EDT1_TRIV3|nr:hypothetical protein TVAGG3_0948780 [Trichomonas vaginalis G3]EAY09147.1 hypothetical protein TVAG_363620 [Trichomonas vaginalis G3]KAI5487064.1 hypothetical protein TVAGG3_0948780 [Trichomonas vaginalis G3]|eukprot:XP_001321370.1 hypothetical protein [Trichomonas vaginalis G3]
MTQRNPFGLSDEQIKDAKEKYIHHLKENDPLIKNEKSGIKKSNMADKKVEEDFKNESDDLRKFLEDNKYITKSGPPKLEISNSRIAEMREIAKSLKDKTTSINLIVAKIRLDN